MEQVILDVLLWGDRLPLKILYGAIIAGGTWLGWMMTWRIVNVVFGRWN